MTRNAILICRNARAPHWQLGELSGASLMLIGWTSSPSSVEGGVPEAIALLLARSLTAVAQVTFASSSPRATAMTWAAAGEDAVRLLKPEKLGDKIVGGFRRRSEIVLLSTRNPATALRMFDDASYPWALQGQVGLLSATEDELPMIDFGTMSDLLSGDVQRHVASLTRAGLLALLRPGVDGDVAGLFSMDPNIEIGIVSDLRTRAADLGVQFEQLSEDTFADRLADV